jgi:hypothetical protein
MVIERQTLLNAEEHLAAEFVGVDQTPAAATDTAKNRNGLKCKSLKWTNASRTQLRMERQFISPPFRRFYLPIAWFVIFLLLSTVILHC